MLFISPITCTGCFILIAILGIIIIGIIWRKKERKERVFIKKDNDGIDWGIDDIK